MEDENQGRSPPSVVEISETNEKETLTDSLKPLWKLTYYSGLLFDWSHTSTTKESHWWKLRHYLVNFFSLLILGSTMIFFLVQMGLKLWTKQDMNELIPSLMWVCPLVFAFGTQLFYLINNQELVLFIRKLRQFEVELNSLPNYKDEHDRSQKIYSAVYLTKLILQCGLLTLYICLLILPESVDQQMNHGWWTLPANVSSSRQLFMMHYKELCHYAHPIFFAMVHIVSMIFATVFVPLADLVPSLVYCHAATAVHALQNAIQLVDSNLDNRMNTTGLEQEGMKPPSQIESDLHRIFSLYEEIRVMVKRTDSLFGFIVVFNHGLTFFMICIFGFSFVFWKEELAYVAMQVAIVIAFLIRITISLKLMVRLHSSSDPLRSALTHLNLSKNRNQLSRNERDLLQSFLARLHTEYLTATPSGLYQIRPTLFLTLTTLTVTYTLILIPKLINSNQ